jgi:hypothetical protein
VGLLKILCRAAGCSAVCAKIGNYCARVSLSVSVREETEIRKEEEEEADSLRQKSSKI